MAKKLTLFVDPNKAIFSHVRATALSSGTMVAMTTRSKQGPQLFEPRTTQWGDPHHKMALTCCHRNTSKQAALLGHQPAVHYFGLLASLDCFHTDRGVICYIATTTTKETREIPPSNWKLQTKLEIAKKSFCVIKHYLCHVLMTLQRLFSSDVLMTLPRLFSSNVLMTPRRLTSSNVLMTESYKEITKESRRRFHNVKSRFTIVSTPLPQYQIHIKHSNAGHLKWFCLP